ncbi:MAG: hypothetical protein ACRDIF_07255 [Actinomycetota bacterium]
MSRRHEPLVFAAAAVASMAVSLTSTRLALNDLPTGRPMRDPAAVLPQILFEPEPARAVRIAPVGPEIGLELRESAASESVGIDDARPAPRPPRARPARPPAPPAAPAAPVEAAAVPPRVRLGLHATPQHGEHRTLITYEGTIHNGGPQPLERLRFASHIPPGTAPRSFKRCGPEALAVTVAYSDSPAGVICIPRQAPGSGAGMHAVDLLLPGPIAKGASATVTFSVEVLSPLWEVSNHAHGEVSGTWVDSKVVVTPLDTKKETEVETASFGEASAGSEPRVKSGSRRTT